MIYFVTDSKHAYTLTVFLGANPSSSIGRLNYDNINLLNLSPKDTIIFCDIDRYNDDRLQKLIRIFDQIKNLGCTIINDPRKVLRRYDLAKALHKASINTYQLYKLESLSNNRLNFPVFLREEFDHNGPTSTLLANHELLEEALQDKNDFQELLIVEYADTSKSTIGNNHKYGAFYYQGKVIPRHFYISEDWNVKNTTLEAGKSVSLEQAYCASNPHEAFIKKVFTIANIDYGRIDYADTSDGLQVFEINTNPMIIEQEDIDPTNPRLKITLDFMQKLKEVLIN